MQTIKRINVGNIRKNLTQALIFTLALLAICSLVHATTTNPIYMLNGNVTTTGTITTTNLNATLVNSTNVNATNYYLNNQSLGFVASDTFTINQTGSLTQAWYGSNGTLFMSDSNGSKVINYALGNGSDVKLTEGTVQLTAPLSCHRYNHLHGAGSTETILSSSTITTLLVISDVDYVEINDLALSTSFNGSHAIIYVSCYSGSSSQGLKIHDVNLYDSSGAYNIGISLEAGNNSGIMYPTIEDCKIFNAGYGIAFNPLVTGNNFITAAYVRGGLIYGFSHYAIGFENGKSSAYGTNYAIIDSIQITHSVATPTTGISLLGYGYAPQLRSIQYWYDGTGAFTSFNIGSSVQYADVEGGHIEGASFINNGINSKIALSDAWNSTSGLNWGSANDPSGVPYRVVYDQNRNTTLTWTNLTLTSEITSRGKGAILVVSVVPSTIGAAGTQMTLNFRAGIGAATYLPMIVISPSMAFVGLEFSQELTVGVDSNQNIEYAIVVPTGWNITTSIYVAGYYTP